MICSSIKKLRGVKLLTRTFGHPVDITDDGIKSIFTLPDVGITRLKSNLKKAEVAITDVGIILPTRIRYKMP